MQLYGGRIFDRGLERRRRKQSESRDAIVWDIDDANKLVRCKIQGSNEYVLCHYPRNSHTLPEFCKRGNSVRIAHKGGLRGYLEITGHGRAIPSPVSGAQFPTPNTPTDAVISGGEVVQYSGMTVWVYPTTVRIDGVLIEMVIVDSIIMDTPGPMTMGAASTYLMGAGAGAYLTLAAAPAAGQFRYDLIVVGTDGVAEVVQGSAAAVPVMPATPADHVKLAHVLVYGGMTTVEDHWINALHEVRHPWTIEFTLASVVGSGTIQNGNEFVWHLTDDTPHVSLTATVKCQYGWAYSAVQTLTFSLVGGTGGISATTSGFGSSNVVKSINGSQAIIYYERDQTETERSPSINCSILNDVTQASERIKLLDINGVEV